MDNNKAIIFLNGNISKKIIKNLKDDSGFYIIAADGAANFLYKQKIKPDYITGDFDSVKPGVIAHFRNKKVKIMQVKEQEHNDFEKCLLYCQKHSLKNILIIGMTGKRLDHALNNLSIMKRYSAIMELKAIDKNFEIFYISSEYSSVYKNNEIISLVGLPSAKGIATEGLYYPLNNEDLEFGIREGALNKCSSENFKITMSEGSLLIFKKHFGKIKELLKEYENK